MIRIRIFHIFLPFLAVIHFPTDYPERTIINMNKSLCINIFTMLLCMVVKMCKQPRSPYISEYVNGEADT